MWLVCNLTQAVRLADVQEIYISELESDESEGPVANSHGIFLHFYDERDDLLYNTYPQFGDAHEALRDLVATLKEPPYGAPRT